MRYKQTVIGVAWALIQPLLTMIVMTVIFGRVAKLPSEGNAPYAVMVFAAMLPWYFFSTSLSSASQSLVGNAQLIARSVEGYETEVLTPRRHAGLREQAIIPSR